VGAAPYRRQIEYEPCRVTRSRGVMAADPYLVVSEAADIVDRVSIYPTYFISPARSLSSAGVSGISMPIAGYSTTYTPEFLAWRNMMWRCLDPHNRRFPRIGGAGIKICERWKNFELFRADMGRRPAGHVLSRRDLEADFTPENCLWERRQEAARRYRTTFKISYKGETLGIAEWARRTGLPERRIRRRLKGLGWSAGQALGLEPRPSAEYSERQRGSRSCRASVRPDSRTPDTR
jgi:hypothetical protein